MKIGIAKPDYGLRGGFEVVLAILTKTLESRGHTIGYLSAKAPSGKIEAYDLDVPLGCSRAAWEYFRYMKLLEGFQSLDASDFDIVVSTQPPSFAVQHPRHLALFYHHLRVFYDLSDVYVAAGFVGFDDHQVAQAAIRRVDSTLLNNVSHFLAPDEVVDRLRFFNQLSNVDVFRAGSGLADSLIEMDQTDDWGPAICISRHEFPKRSELFVHAMKYLPDMRGSMIGSGGRLPWLKHLDRILSDPAVDQDAYGPEKIWLNPGIADYEDDLESNINYLEGLSEPDLVTQIRKSLCVVAPAFLEDYGLTAIEAMASGKPVIVCKDGGGLARMVIDGVNGFVVDPDGRSIAEAIRILRDDIPLARKMGQAGKVLARNYSWDIGVQQFLDALEVV